jgi:hypothetical protein
MTQPTKTPLPWKVVPCSEYEPLKIINYEEELVCGWPISREHAETICLAVNLHDELVRCLRNMTNLYVELQKHNTPSSHEANAVLAKCAAQPDNAKGEGW